jgi:hypothetical protein
VLLSHAKYSSQLHVSQLALPATNADSNHRTLLVSIPPSVVQVLNRFQAAGDDLHCAAEEIRKELNKK